MKHSGWLPSLAMALALASCEGRRNIGEHVFDIPPEFVEKGTIFFLPRPGKNSLLLVLNPKAPLPEQISVLVEPAHSRCDRPGEAVTNMLDYVCDDVARGVHFVFDGAILVKRSDLQDDVFWRYEVTVADGQSRVVATCFRVADGGSCNALGAYDDLVFNVNFNDRDVAQIPQFMQMVRDRLREWEVQS